MPFLGSKYVKIAFALPRTPLGELTALPRSPSWIKGPTSKGRGGEGGQEREGEVRRKLRPPCLKFLDPPLTLDMYTRQTDIVRRASLNAAAY